MKVERLTRSYRPRYVLQEGSYVSFEGHGRGRRKRDLVELGKEGGESAEERMTRKDYQNYGLVEAVGFSRFGFCPAIFLDFA